MPLLHLSLSFSIWIPSLSVLSRFLSLSLWLTLYYGSISNMASDTCPLLSASVYFHPFVFLHFLFFFSRHPSVLVCQPFPPSVFQFPPLCDIARAIHTCTRAHAQSQTGIPWMRLAGQFELCGAALRDCVPLRLTCGGGGRGGVRVCAHMHMHMSTCI